VQHEFGIYPGPDGEDVIPFVEGCTRPILTVLHTVLPDPSSRQRAILDGLAERSNLLVVHTQAACQRLLDTHHFDPTKVAVVPHGASPNLHGSALVESAEPLLLTWGLLGPGKGIEHGIEAVALMRERGLDVRYLVAGETHPNVRAQHGELYREGLRAAAVRRHVADLVDFDDEYRDWDSLHALVRSASIVLVPYDSRDQVTSGVLVEALAAGKPVVSTAFPHAVELAASGAVRVVPHEAPAAIADAVQHILEHPSTREAMTAAARAEGARYNWSSIGQQLHSHLHDIVGNQNGLRNGAGLACS
jgi:glycosyltransferase involved in cell wall biosynthesis